MSKTSSNRCSTPSFPATRSAWRREPLVKIYLAPRQPPDGGAEHGRLADRRQIDIVHIVEKALGRQLVLGHQPGKRGAVAVVIILLDAPRLLQADAEELRKKRSHALIDLGKEIAFGWVERVVEVKNPAFDFLKTAEIGKTDELHRREICMVRDFVISCPQR